ncbi:MAG TPA: hypothetical protein VKA49_03670 [Flavitalea sp.]|nr:hypothetical protein [Flavitalea sp.]
MKTVISTLSRTAIVLLAVFTMSFSTNPETHGKSEIPAELKYLGSRDNQPQFQLVLTNTESDEFVVTIRNKGNEVIYKEKIKGANLSRKYQLNLDDADATGVTFEVVSKTTKSRVAYTVNATSRLVQDVSITAQ